MWWHHWVYVDAWGPIWPNLAAGLIGWSAGLFVADKRMKHHLSEHQGWLETWRQKL